MRGMYWEEWEIGAEFESPARTVTEADIVQFAGLSGDYNPLHVNEEILQDDDVRHPHRARTAGLRYRGGVALPAPPVRRHVDRFSRIRGPSVHETGQSRGTPFTHG